MTKVFGQCFFEDETSGRREEVRIINYTILSTHLEATGTSSLLRAKPGDFYFLIFRPTKFDEWGCELRAKAKIVHINGRRVHFSFTDQSEMILREGQFPIELAVSDSAPKVMGSTRHPWFVSHPMVFRLRGLGRNTFFFELVPQGNKDILLPDSEVEIKLEIPLSGTFFLKGKISSVWREQGHFRVKFEFLKMPDELNQALALFMIEATENLPVEELARVGLRAPHFTGRAEMGVIFSKEELDAVLELRKKAYLEKSGSTVAPETTPQSFRDRFDDYSALIGIRLGKSVVATGRVVFNYGLLDQSELYHLGAKIPAVIIKSGFVEASRLATDPRFRGRDLLQLLLFCCFRQAHLTAHRYILLDCEDHLLPLYRSIGAKVCGPKIVHPLENIELNVLILDLKRVLFKARCVRWLPFLTRRFAAFSRAMKALTVSQA